MKLHFLGLLLYRHWVLNFLWIWITVQKPNFVEHLLMTASGACKPYFHVEIPYSIISFITSSYLCKKCSNIFSFFFPDISKFLKHHCIKLFKNNNFVWRHQNSMTSKIVLGTFNWSY